jgi:hypothetical protein
MHVAMQKLFRKREEEKSMKKWTTIQENKTMGTLCKVFFNYQERYVFKKQY